MKQSSLSRRKFIKTGIAGAVGAGLINAAPSVHAKERKNNIGTIKEYRMLGRTGFEVSDISFGAVEVNNPAVLLEAVNRGINYIDTAEAYRRGQSEKVVGEVMKKTDRKKIFITTKIALTRRPGKIDKDGIRERTLKCLERLQTDYIDCMMIHMCQKNQVSDKDFHAAMNELKGEGKVRFLGLSNHDKQQQISGSTNDTMEDVFGAAAEDGRFDVFMFVYNFILRKPGEDILKICKEKNIGTVLMKTNPVAKFHEYRNIFEEREKQGKPLLERFRKILDDYGAYTSKAEDFKKKYNLVSENDIRDAAIRFILSNQQVNTAAMTFSNFDKLNAYLSLSGTRLNSHDTGMLHNYKRSLGSYYCRHACGICESACPDKVPVNTIMRYNHYFSAKEREKYAMSRYAELRTADAGQCLRCAGHCESSCPYGVPVQSLLISADRNLRFS